MTRPKNVETIRDIVGFRMAREGGVYVQEVADSQNHVHTNGEPYREALLVAD